MGVYRLIMLVSSILVWHILIRDYLKVELPGTSQVEDEAQPLGDPVEKDIGLFRKLGKHRKV